MRVTCYSTRKYERSRLEAAAAAYSITFDFTELPLEPATAGLARGSEGICVFVNDQVSAPVQHLLSTMGVRYVALRCAGFNSVDLDTAKELGIQVARVPAYSPEAVAEHAFALLLGLSRKTHRAYNRVREMNFSLDGLVGFNLFQKTVGVIGCGKIGLAFCRIAKGFGMNVLAYDPTPDHSTELEYVDLETIWSKSDVISLHCPLTPETKHLISDDVLAKVKPGVVIINTSRGAVVDSLAAIRALKSGQLAGLGIDVYEEESGLFFRDLSAEIPVDDVFVRLMTFPNVLITGHQAFLTEEALNSIAEVTAANLAGMESGDLPSANRVV